MPTAFANSTTVTVTTSLSTTPPVAFGRVHSGRILGRTYPTNQLTVYECDTPGGTYALCNDVGTNGVLATLDEDVSMELPTKLAGCQWLKFVGSAEGEMTFVFKAD